MVVQVFFPKQVLLIIFLLSIFSWRIIWQFISIIIIIILPIVVFYTVKNLDIESREKNIFDNYDEFEIRCKKLDEFNFKNKISFIKIDVEGHEIEVVNGSKELIKNFKPNLMIEIEEKHSKNDLNNSISYICSLGYRVFCLKNKELTPLENIENIKQFNNFIFKPI